MTPDTAAVIPAGGAGLRMGHATPKQFLPLAGVPVIVRTIRAIMAAREVGAIILVVPEEAIPITRDILIGHGLDQAVQIVAGGRLRQDSVEQGLLAVPAGFEYTLVHDGVRPLVTLEIIQRCLQAARQSGAAITAVPVKDTLKTVTADHRIANTVDRQGLWQAQTPQAARTELLLKAHAMARQDHVVGTDEAGLLSRIHIPVTVVEGSETNIKITRPGDLTIAEALLSESKGMPSSTTTPCIGHGYDAHRLVAGRPLVLGGITIDYDRGLLGHSDADVLTHALCDAILGAMGQGDIGRHFPDSDPQYKGVSSITLLEKVTSLARRHGYELINADVTMIAQAPKLAPHFNAMRAKLAIACGVSPEAVNLKATTTEEMGFAGRGEGMAAHAVALLARTA